MKTFNEMQNRKQKMTSGDEKIKDGLFKLVGGDPEDYIKLIRKSSYAAWLKSDELESDIIELKKISKSINKLNLLRIV